MKRLFTLLFASIVFQLSATHILSSKIGYVFTDSSNGLYNYKVSLTMKRFCGQGSVDFPAEVKTLVYNNDNMNKIGEQICTLTNKTSYSDCVNKCEETAYYETTISLSKNLKGYYLCAMYCCRYPSNNLRKDQSDLSYQGSMPYCWISGETPSSSPVTDFPDAIFQRINRLDTFSFATKAPYSDSLSVELCPSYTAGSNSESEPAPETFPGLSAAMYTNGYAWNWPLSFGSIFQIKSNTGELIIQGNQNGNYNFALKFKSFKNGKLISESLHEGFVYIILNEPTITLGGSPMSSNSALLKWTSCYPFSKHYIERSYMVPSDYKTIDSTADNSMSYLDSGLEAGKNYYYRVRIRDSYGKTYYSNYALMRIWKVGISDLNFNQRQLLLYPSPANTVCDIHLPGEMIKSYQIRDLTGKLILNKITENETNHSRIDLLSLSNGTYLIYVEGESGNTYYSKLIKL